MDSKRAILGILFLLAVTFQNLSAQKSQTQIESIALIDSLINSKSYKKANEALKYQIAYYFENNLDSLPNYVRLIGSYSLANNNWEQALNNAEKFINKLEQTGDTVVLKNAYLELANLYDDKGDPDTAYEKTTVALELAKKIKNKKEADLEGVYYNLGTKAFNKGDFALSKKHQLKNLALRNKSGDSNHEMYYYTYNTMGRLMWFSGQPDSAIYYFKRAIKSVKLLDSKPWNQFYRPALLNGNLAVLLQAQGEVKKAISVTEQAIEQLNVFNNLSDNEADKLSALKQKLASIDNLGVYFNSIGEYEKAEQLISYSFEQKKRTLDPDDINLTISMMILGQSQMSTRKFEEAETNLLKALERLDKNKNSNIYYKAFVLSTLGNLYKEIGAVKKASTYYTRGEEVFRKTMNDDYSKDFLDELSNMALFYAQNGNSEKAIRLINEAYEFSESSSFNGKLQNYLLLTAKSQVHYTIGDYENALTYATKGLDFLKEKTTKTDKVDSIQIYSRKPRNLVIWAKSRYELTAPKTIELYDSLISQLEESINILDQRKSILTATEDLNALVEENEELFKFLKQLYQESYNLTKNPVYLSKLLSIHESSIYSRIRTRLNQKDVVFSKVPTDVLAEEKKKKNQLIKTLKNADDSNVATFFEARKNWYIFLDSVKIAHPEYYAIRYGEIIVSLDDIHKNIPEETTIVRYLFINDRPMVYVSDGNYKEIYELEDIDLQHQISRLNDYTQDISEISMSLQNLYNALWKPFAHKIKTKNIIIIPDAELFNLSFELLTAQKISSYDELSSKSLLGEYSISYNYSLLLVNNENKVLEFNDDFVAFAPEFDSEMKKDYQMAITDSLYLDKSYLSLLPQPFSLDIAKKYGQLFNGKSYLNEKASKQIFTKSAKEHKVIHIGTHAESNNLSPELSRLVFAKNISDSTNINDNYLYTFEIYNQDLSSNLAILTACETGKPTYQPGEGMISLAHAFNYAGSESILTSLWQIDEQSSTQILGYFYSHLKEGLSKDEALKNAKLDYLAKAEGRTLHPQYWAGLVLMGDTAPIELSDSQNWLWWVIIGSIIVVMALLVRKRKSLR